MQAAYTAGHLTYPRAREGCGFSDSAAQAVTDAATTLQIAPKVGLPSWKPSREQPHETPRPTNVKRVAGTVASTPNWMLTPFDFAARCWLRCALRFQAGYGDEVAAISADDGISAPAWLGDLAFERPDPRTPAVLLDDMAGMDAELVLYPADEVTFLGLHAAGLARPSTIVDVATMLVERGFVDEDGLTERGRAAAAATPDVVADGTLDASLEGATQDVGDVPLLDLLARTLGPLWKDVREQVMPRPDADGHAEGTNLARDTEPPVNTEGDEPQAVVGPEADLDTVTTTSPGWRM